ncbi:hypothetical protein G7Z17_g6120 [Cylindrodendrum hubeiense]|uniref:Uncharacterized protein n=1 Tax=Cylindrodendrum hubeiense TaxID=595255 RepID=A0A9P5HAJ3_9HYPO|nr:hypothetical protein G7Z17_g6120 [Cylindrodendrum hubeiense]
MEEGNEDWEQELSGEVKRGEEPGSGVRAAPSLPESSNAPPKLTWQTSSVSGRRPRFAPSRPPTRKRHELIKSGTTYPFGVQYQMSLDGKEFMVWAFHLRNQYLVYVDYDGGTDLLRFYNVCRKQTRDNISLIQLAKYTGISPGCVVNVDSVVSVANLECPGFLQATGDTLERPLLTQPLRKTDYAFRSSALVLSLSQVLVDRLDRLDRMVSGMVAWARHTDQRTDALEAAVNRILNPDDAAGAPSSSSSRSDDAALTPNSDEALSLTGNGGGEEDMGDDE